MYIKKQFDTLGLPKLLPLPWIVVFVALGITPAVAAGPGAEQLLLNFYTNTGHDRVNGTAKLITETYSPVLNEKQLFPPDYPDDKKKKAIQYYRDYYDINFGNRGIPERNFSAHIVYYDGESKRKDTKNIPDKASFEEFTQKSEWGAGFDRHYDTDGKMTSISDQGPFTANDPQAVIEYANLGVPEIHRFGKVRASPEDGKAMADLIDSGHFQVSGEATDGGYRAVMVADKGFLTRVEVLFDAENNYAVKEIKNYAKGELYDHKLYSEYAYSENGEYVPRKIVNRRYAPWWAGISQDMELSEVPLGREPVLTFEEVTIVEEIDFNVDLPEGAFVPTFVNGTTVYDMTVQPPLEYTHGVKNTDIRDALVMIDQVELTEEFLETPAAKKQADNIEAKHQVETPSEPEIESIKEYRVPYWALTIGLLAIAFAGAWAYLHKR